jgi:uncharacterized membrane protein YphA (DoxX/SURF4 family)
MLSIFPDLLPFGGFAPMIIRLVVGGVILFFGALTVSSKRKISLKKLTENNYPAPNFMVWALGLIKIIVGLFLIAGFITQISAIIAAYFFLNLAIIESKDEKTKIFNQSTLTYTLLIATSLSLLFSGAGFFAMDLPL